MKFLNYILNGFSRVLSVDAEFLLDSTGTSPQRVLCLVFKDIQTGEIFRHWVDGKSHVPHFFDYESCLLVSFNCCYMYIFVFAYISFCWLLPPLFFFCSFQFWFSFVFGCFVCWIYYVLFVIWRLDVCIHVL